MIVANDMRIGGLRATKCRYSATSVLADVVGFVAALLSFGLLKGFGEPAVDRAIAFESAMDEAKAEAEQDAGGER